VYQNNLRLLVNHHKDDRDDEQGKIKNNKRRKRRNTDKNVNREGIISRRTLPIVVVVEDITGVIDIIEVLQTILPIAIIILRVRMTNQIMNTGVMTGGDGNTRNGNGEELLGLRDTIVSVGMPVMILRVDIVVMMYLLVRRHGFRTWKRLRN